MIFIFFRHIRLSPIIPSTFLQTFAPAVFLLRIMVSELPSSHILSFFQFRSISSSFLCTLPHYLRLLFPNRTVSPCLLNISFHSISCSWRSASSSATTIRSFAYNSFQSMSFVPVFLLSSSITAINNKGLNKLPCLRPPFTLNYPDTPGPHSTLLFMSSYAPYTILTSGFGTLIHLSVAISISFEIASHAFSKSISPVAIFSCPSSFFSTSCLMTNIPSVAPLPFLNPCYTSPMSPSNIMLLFCHPALQQLQHMA